MESNPLNFNLFNSIILAGIIQGFVFGLAVFLSRKYQSPGIKYLVGLIVAFSLNNLQYYLQDSGLISSTALYTLLFVPYQLIAGVLLLFYGLCLIGGDGKLPSKAKWTLLPFALGFALTTAYKIVYVMGYNAQVYPYFSVMPALIELVSIVIDMVVVVYLLSKIKRLERSEFSPLHIAPALHWFRTILIVFFFLSFLWIFNATLSFVYGIQTAYYPLWIAMSVMIYWMGHVGIYKFGVEQERKKIRSASIAHKSLFESSRQKNEHIAALEKWVVGEKMFLNPTLTIDKIAEKLQLSKGHLSRIVNTELGTSFPDYLNTLRVEEAKAHLANPDFANYTLLAIGLEAGFNSKTTFNAAFKKVTSQTPSEYRNSIAQFETSQNSVA